MGKGGDGGAKQARADEQARQERIRQGTVQINNMFDGYTDPTGAKVPGQFNDAYYDGRRQSYLDYATPQLNDQYGDAQKQLTFALDRNGLLDSSIRAQRFGSLTKQYDTQKRGVADTALGFSNTARDNVESARANLIQQLNATGDATGTVQAATSRAAALSQPEAYQPLAQLFGAFTTGLGQQAQAEKAAILGANNQAYQTQLYNNSRKSVRTT